jgi:signal peptidase I
MHDPAAIRTAARPRTTEHRHRRERRAWPRRIAVALLAVLAGVFVAGAVLVNVEHLKLEPVLSGSMRPGIQPGDLAVIKPAPTNELRVGEIIAYLPPGQTTPVLHRIVSITSAGIVTQGDANRVADPWGRVKPQTTTVERLVAVVPKVGWLIDIRRTLLIVAGGVLLLAVAIAVGSSTRKSSGATDDSAGESAPTDSQSHETPKGEVVK